VETKRIHVSALSPLGGGSKNSFEVLRLGLGEPGSSNPRISNTPLLATRINLGIGAPLFEFGCGLGAGGNNDDASNP
jgi:hypothetical protein